MGCRLTALVRAAAHDGELLVRPRRVERQVLAVVEPVRVLAPPDLPALIVEVARLGDGLLDLRLLVRRGPAGDALDVGHARGGVGGGGSANEGRDEEGLQVHGGGCRRRELMRRREARAASRDRARRPFCQWLNKYFRPKQSAGGFCRARQAGSPHAAALRGWPECHRQDGWALGRAAILPAERRSTARSHSAGCAPGKAAARHVKHHRPLPS